MNIYQKLAKVRQLCEVFEKNKTGYSYKYTSIDEILAKVTAGMKKYSISLIPRVYTDTMTVAPNTFSKTKMTKTGEMYEDRTNEYVVSGMVSFTWLSDDDPQDCVEIPWFVTGSQADPSQAFGSAMTYGLRYFLLDYFQIATLDESDPDNWRSKQKEAEETEQREVANTITDKVLELINSHLGTKPEDRDKIIDIVKKYAKEKGRPSNNPKVIKDPVVAGKLLEEIGSICGTDNGGTQQPEVVVEK